MENVRKFYEAMAGDAAMRERAKKLNGIKPDVEAAVLDAIVAFATKEGYSFTVDEAKTYIAENAGTELSDEQLEMVAGGINWGKVWPQKEE